MAFPFFYIENYEQGQKSLTLDEDNSRHIVSVLRMQVGEHMHLTDGHGILLTAEITNDHKKHCEVVVVETKNIPQSQNKNIIAISLLKNPGRFEWFLEKATELGISEIIPMICERTEKQKFREDRMKSILVSAMLQSKQCYLPELHLPEKFHHVIDTKVENRFIAHCIEKKERDIIDIGPDVQGSSMVLIGPEGDFSAQEVTLAIEKGFQPVTLGNTRLRTETAGLAAAVLLAASNNK